MNIAPKARFRPVNPHYEAAVRSSFNDQGIMHLLGASMRTIEPGFCVIDLPFNSQLTQQDGFYHAGATSTIADSAGGYAAFSLMPKGSRVLTVEFKVNLLSTADGELLSAHAEVVKAGKTLTVVTINVNCLKGSSSTLCAVVQQTTICITPQDFGDE